MRRAGGLALLGLLVAAASTFAVSDAAPAKHPPAASKSAARIPLPPRAMGEADAKAATVAKQLSDAMGGQRTWDVLPYFRFDFVVVQQGKEVARFQHWWDKRNGRCRVQGPDDKGRTVTAIFTLKDKKGKSFTDGIVDTDPTNIANIVQMGYERWVNDTYWIIMPFKLRDPGTHLKYVRLKRLGGKDYDVLQLSFDRGVGLTSGDRYTLYVNRSTHLLDKWDMMLEGKKPPPATSTWEQWTPIGPVKLALNHRLQGKPVEIRFDNVAVPQTMDPGVFANARVPG
ncbi:MAG TPA: DUF6503 family protein [Candidatus Binatia bacterium]|nr:DUF6503 family protein [Candidatus Binatia bacterium]